MSPLLALSRHRQSSAECLLFGENWTYPDKTNLDRAEPVETGSAPQIVRFARHLATACNVKSGRGNMDVAILGTIVARNCEGVSFE
jgi:hypothetical protein